MKNLPQNIDFKRNYQTIVLLVFIWMTGVSLNAYSQMRFNSERLKQIFGMLPDGYKREIEAKCNSNQGIFIIDAKLIEDKSNLVFRINQYHELDHLGFDLINSQNLANISEVCDYLERAFLVSALIKEKYLLSEEVTKKNIVVLYNGNSLNQQNALTVLPTIEIDKKTPLQIRFDSNFFLIKWALQSLNTLEVRIPNNYSLITEKTKDELERDLLRKFKFSKEGKADTKRPSKNQLKPYAANIYLFPGEIYSTTPELSSSKYFALNDSIYPVFSNRYYKESIRNLFLNMISTPVMLNITQKLYGGNDEEFRLNVNNFLQNFSSDHKVYFGWQNVDKDNLKASIFISNTVYNYNHLLVISANAKAVFRKNGEVNGMFFAYVPKENLK